MKKGPFLLNQASLKPKGDVTLALTVTTPTHDLTSNKYLHELVHPHTSYQLIPSIPKTQLFEVEDAILTLLPLSRYAPPHSETASWTSPCPTSTSKKTSWTRSTSAAT